MSRTEEAGSDVLCYRELTLEPASFRAMICGRPLHLTKREFEILSCMLASAPGRVFTRRELAEASLAGGRGGKEHSVFVHIFHIRRKIREMTGEEYIETVRGTGFRLH